jgi:hypothetical protein
MAGATVKDNTRPGRDITNIPPPTRPVLVSCRCVYILYGPNYLFALKTGN